MRKNIIACLLFLISSNLLAQNYDSNQNVDKFSNSIDVSKVQFGIKMTPAIAWLNVVHNNMTAEGATMKFGAGIVANYPLISNLSLVSGVNYHGFGGYAHDNKSLGYTDTLSTYKINYKEIEIPLALKLQTSVVKKTSYFIQGGFAVGFVTSANEKRIPKDDNLELNYEDINLYTNPTRISYQVGAGMQYWIGRTSNIFALISYNNAITNIANTSNYTTTIQPNHTPRYNSRIEILPGSMEFSVGIMF